MRRYIITVNRHLLEQTDPANQYVEPIMVEDTQTGERASYYKAELVDARIVYGPPRQDGARVWVEAATVYGTKLP